MLLAGRGAALLGLMGVGCLMACGGRAGSSDAADSVGGQDTAFGGRADDGGPEPPRGGASGSLGGASTGSGDATVSVGGASGGVAIGVAAGTGGAENSAGGRAALTECALPQPVAPASGFVQCGDGTYRRLAAGECQNALPRPEPVDYQVAEDCWYDKDCVAAPYGYCTVGECHYGCTADSDCNVDELCFCGDAIGTCVQTSCWGPADCEPQSACVAGNPRFGFFCFGSGRCLSSNECGPELACYMQVCQEPPPG
jgi:hypothetical protein